MTMNDRDPFRKFDPDTKKKPTPKLAGTEWVSLRSVPDGVEPPPRHHPKHGQPTVVYTYCGLKKEILGYVCRFDKPDGDKVFCPLTYCKQVGSGATAWRWQSWDQPRPLYGLDRLGELPNAPVLVCEGEKAADAARRLFPGHVVITSPSGSKAVKKADWTPIKDRVVVIWPDNDEPGLDYARSVATMLGDGNRSVSIVSPIDNKSAGWDVAEGWTADDANCFIAGASQEVRSEPGQNAGDLKPGCSRPRSARKSSGNRQSHSLRGGHSREALLELVGDCEFWHDAEHRPYATVPVGEHLENMRLDSRAFETWLSGKYYRELSETVSEQSRREVVNALQGRAVYGGLCYETFLRLGGHDGRLYLDLGRPDWSLVEIGPDGWGIVDHCPLKAIRTPNMDPLPIPEPGELLDVGLRPLLNVASERDMRLIIAWILTAMRDVGEYPILCISGEQGSAKSTMAKLIRTLIDPSKAASRAAPREERDLMVSAKNSRVLSFDNLSGISAWLSDALCRISTGGAYSARALHTDTDEVVIQVENPIILNGIPEMPGRPDLADRSLMINLPSIDDADRRSSSEFWAEFYNRWPFILGAILDAVSAALRNHEKVRLDRRPRMANAAEWVTAAEPALGWATGTHLADLEANHRHVNEAVLENEPVALALLEMKELGKLPFSGTMTRLQRVLQAEHRTSIPKSAQDLGIAMRRIKPLLAEHGIVVEHDRKKERIVTIRLYAA